MKCGTGFDQVSTAAFHGDSLHAAGHTHADVEVDWDHRTNIDILSELTKSLSGHGEMVRIERDIRQTESPRAIRAHGAAVTADWVMNFNLRTGNDCAGRVRDHALNCS